jgi:glyoxylase-like metal-dependent hydrolase (beta-lactamase superfamily II)
VNGTETHPRHPGEDGRLYLRQMLSGRDFARHDQLARQMVNFAYVIGDSATRECLLVDPAYGVGEIIDAVEADGMVVTGVLVTHYHPDHVGGNMMGHDIEGLAAVLSRHDVPVHVNAAEVPWVERVTGVGGSHLVAHSSGDMVRVGELDVNLLHTPGHTPGSQCFLVEGCLVSGDTLFLDGCGRTDLPGSDPGQMWDSLQLLSSLPDETTVLPGHLYSPEPAGLLGEVRRDNYVFRPRNREEWLAFFGRH